MQTKTVGEILCEERTVHKISLDDLSKLTRIRKAYLQALEENQFDKLPAAIFVKGYIKAYARLFAFDYQPLLALLRRDYKESAKGKLVPREFLKPVLKNKQYIKPVTMVILGLAMAFLSLSGYVAWQWYNLNKPPELTIESPQEEEFVAPQVIVKGKTNPEAVVLINAQPVAIQVDGSFTSEVYLSKEGISTITIEAADRRGKSSLIQRTVYVRY